MKSGVLIITSLLVSHPFVAAADSADEGPFELTEAGMDAVTAGSISVPPSAAVNALADATGDLTITGTSAGTFIQNSPVPLAFGSAPAWVTAVGGTATATSIGPTSGRSTDIVTTPEVAAAAAINPYAATINWTRTILGTEISAFAQVAPGGPLLDFFHHRVKSIRNW